MRHSWEWSASGSTHAAFGTPNLRTGLSNIALWTKCRRKGAGLAPVRVRRYEKLARLPSLVAELLLFVLANTTR